MAYNTYVNIRTAVLGKIGIDDTDVEDVVKQALNDVLQEICQAFNFSWLYGDSSFITVKPYETGTVTVTEGSATITGIGTVWTSGMVGRKFYCGNATYVIATFVSAISMTLTTNYAGDSGSLTYKIYQDEYSLASDVEDVLSMRQENSPLKLRKSGIEEIDNYYPLRTSFGYPVYYSIVGYDSSEKIKVALYPIPDQARNIYYRYKKRVTEMSADNDSPIIPERYRYVLLNGALYQAADNLDMPEIAKRYEILYEKSLARIIAADSKKDERIVKGGGEETESGNFLGSNYPLSPL